MLSREDFSVEIVGPALGGRVWSPLAGAAEFPIRVLPAGTRRDWASSVDGDVLVAVKPRQDSLGLALKASRATARPVVADVDDWEMAFFYDYPARMVKQSLAISSPRNIYRTWWAERQIPRADAISVSTTWLQGRFGGRIIPHARDENLFDPSQHDRGLVRQQLGFSESDVVVMFVGTVMKHKGVDLIVEAMARSGRRDLVLASHAEISPTASGLPRVARLPFVDMDKLPGVLVAADAVVLPQRDSRASRAQLPAKIFDAMAMGVPVIASDVSDLRGILGAGGVVVPPGDISAMGEALALLAASKPTRASMGAAGRERFRTHFSVEALRPAWLAVVAEAKDASPRATTVRDRRRLWRSGT